MTAAAHPGTVRAGVTGTALAHGALLVLILVTAHRAAAPSSIVYDVNLVAAPMPEPAVHNVAPAATPTTPDDVAPPVRVKPKRTPPPPSPPKPKPAAQQHAPKAPVTQATQPPAPGAAPSTGDDAVTLRQQGVAFPYPEYLKRIENEIFRRWDHTMFRPGFDAKIAFVIQRDGTVAANSIETAKSSGNLQFDLNARSAVESAGNQHAFGPLPDGFNGASLPILFDFSQVRGNP